MPGIWDEDVTGRGDVEVWDRTYAINLRGAFLVTDAADAAPRKARRLDRLRLLDGRSARRGAALGVRGVEGSVHLLHEVAGGGARPARHPGQRVAPGWVDTDMSAATLANPIARSEIEKSIPIGRVATAADIAGPILFLVSDLARHLQGEVVNVNGGSVLVG